MILALETATAAVLGRRSSGRPTALLVAERLLRRRPGAYAASSAGYPRAAHARPGRRPPTSTASSSAWAPALTPACASASPRRAPSRRRPATRRRASPACRRSPRWRWRWPTLIARPRRVRCHSSTADAARSSPPSIGRAGSGVALDEHLAVVPACEIGDVRGGVAGRRRRRRRRPTLRRRPAGHRHGCRRP